MRRGVMTPPLRANAQFSPTNHRRSMLFRSSSSSNRPTRACVAFACIILIALRAFAGAPSTQRDAARAPRCDVTPSDWSARDALARANELTRASERKSTTGFTILLNTYERREELKRAVSHYAKCPGVESIRVTWSEQTPAPVEGVDDGYFVKHSAGYVRYRTYKGTTIQNRFEPYDDIETRAVFNVDDDVWIPCATLTRGFKDWKRNADALVGFFPRDYAPARNPPDGCTWKYVANELTLWRTGRYSIILTKAAFMDQKYLRLYKEKLPEAVREYVDKVKNCEDLAMQFLVSSVTRNPVKFTRASLYYYLKAKIGGVGLDGISKGASHKTQRGECITRFQTMFGAPQIPLAEAFW